MLEYRNKGLGSALSSRALADAQAAGCKKAILISSPSGRRLYEKLGFKEFMAYGMYGNY